MFSELVLAHRPWSVSKIGTLKQCQRLYKLRYLDKVPHESTGEAARVGTATHYVLERALKTDTATFDSWLIETAEKENLTKKEINAVKKKLPGIESFLNRISIFRKKMGVEQVFTEMDWAIGTEFEAIHYFNKTGLLRGKVDYAMVTSEQQLIIIDHKSGKRRPLAHHYPQLNTYSLLGAANLDVQAVQCVIHYVGDPDLQRMPGMTIEDIRAKLRPWLTEYLNKLAPAITNIETGNAEAQVSALCAWCPYATQCAEGSAYLDRRYNRTKES